MLRKIIFSSYFLSFNIFCAEITLSEFIAEEFKDHENTAELTNNSIYYFTIVYPEKKFKKMDAQQLKNTYEFEYLLCVKLINFLLKKEKKLRLPNKKLDFLKEKEIIGTIKDYIIYSINQEANTLINHIKTENNIEQLESYSRLRKICILINRLSNRLLDIVFDLNNGDKTVRDITINKIWCIYNKTCFKIKEKEKKYANICKKNDSLLAATGQINHNTPNNHQEIVNLIKLLIKSMRKLYKYE